MSDLELIGLRRKVAELEAALELIAAQGYEGDPHAGYCHPEGCSSPGIARDALNAVPPKGTQETEENRGNSNR